MSFVMAASDASGYYYVEHVLMGGKHESDGRCMGNESSKRVYMVCGMRIVLVTGANCGDRTNSSQRTEIIFLRRNVYTFVGAPTN